MTLVGYARVSTGDQDHAMQREALTAAGRAKIFTETASDALRERLALFPPARLRLLRAAWRPCSRGPDRRAAVVGARNGSEPVGAHGLVPISGGPL